MRRSVLHIVLLPFLIFNCFRANRHDVSQNPPQNFSSHQHRLRIPHIDYPGENVKIFLPPVDSAEIFLPDNSQNADSLVLLIHFHGAAFVGKHSVAHSTMPAILININLGQGSSVYERPFLGKNKFPAMLSTIKKKVKSLLNRPTIFSRVILSSFSAGYGSIRTILRSKNNIQLIDGIILLDGMHTDYDSTHASGLNVDKLNMYLPFAQQAIAGKKVMLITHSSIVPGDYASNKETSDYLIKKSGLIRRKIEKKGPGQMIQTSLANQGNLFIFGFSGTTASDHIDHFHALPYWLNFVLEHFKQ